MKLNEAELQAELDKFSNHYDNEYDVEKVKAGGDAVKEKIVDTYINSSDNPNLKSSKDEFKKAAIDSINNKEVEKQIEKGNSTVDAELEKFKKPEDERNSTIKESQKNLNNLFESIYSYEDALNSNDALIDDIDDYTFDYDYNEDDDCTSNKSFGDGQVTVPFEYSKNEDGSIDLNVDLSNVINEIDSLVDDEFEKELDNYELNGGAYGDAGIVNTIASKFDLDGEKVFNECKHSVPDSILKLAEQVKAKYIREYAKNMEK